MIAQVLAPNASVTSSAKIDGAIFAKNLTTTSEVHLPGYNGNIDVFPEPSTALISLFGVLGLLLRRKR